MDLPRSSDDGRDPIGDIARTVLGDRVPIRIERAGDGISTLVYRLSRGQEIFYLRILPEVGDSFAPEAYVHTLLRRHGVHLPEVLYLEHGNEALQRSVMVTTQIRGRPLSSLSFQEAPTDILMAAGRDLAIINSVPVDGFGWVKREVGRVDGLEAEQASNRMFLLENLDQHLSALAESALTSAEVDAIYGLIARHAGRLDVAQGRLAHGDFDLTHIYQEHGRYTGIIDFSEIRGTGPSTTWVTFACMTGSTHRTPGWGHWSRDTDRYLLSPTTTSTRPRS